MWNLDTNYPVDVTAVKIAEKTQQDNFKNIGHQYELLQRRYDFHSGFFYAYSTRNLKLENFRISALGHLEKQF